MKTKMETSIMGYTGTTIRIHAFIPSLPPMVSLGLLSVRGRGPQENFASLRDIGLPGKP